MVQVKLTGSCKQDGADQRHGGGELANQSRLGIQEVGLKETEQSTSDRIGIQSVCTGQNEKNVCVY